MLLLIGIFIALEGVAIAAVMILRRDQDLRRLVPVIVATALGVGVAGVAYIWIFQEGPQCSGRADFACQLNANQGVLTLLGLVLAIGALWTTVLIRFFDQRSEARSLRSRVDMALTGAMEEVRHNLIHVALAYSHSGDFTDLPVIKIDETCRLLDEPVRRMLSPQVVRGAELIQRNYAVLADLAERRRAGSDEPFESPEPHCIGGLTNHSLRFLIAGGESNQEGHEFLHQPGLQDLHDAALTERNIFFCFRTSDPVLEAEAPRLRSEGAWVVCWWNDKPPERLRVLAQGPRFDDLAEGHSAHA